MRAFYRINLLNYKKHALSLHTITKLKSPHFTEVILEIISWLGRKNLFQTFELQDEAKFEHEIK